MAEPEDTESEEKTEPAGSNDTTNGGGVEPTPGESFKKGVGLLWRAARTGAGEIKNEVAKAGLVESLEQAGRDLEVAAQQAAKALEEYIERAGPKPPEPNDADNQPSDDESDKDVEAGGRRIEVDSNE